MLEGKLGAEGSYKVEFIGGNIVIMAKTEGAQGAADLTVSFALSEMLKEIAAKSDNKWDDALVEFLMKQLGQ